MAIFKDVEIYLMDTNFRVTHIIDDFASFLWTDRYNECGEFEIKVPLSEMIINNVKKSYYFWYRDSERMMIIEDIRMLTDADQGNFVLIAGRSLETILERRIVWAQTTITGNLQNGIKRLLNDAIINPSNAYRKIPNFRFIDSDDPLVTSLTHEEQFTGDNIYDVVKRICQQYEIGFKVLYNQKTNTFDFSLYAGVDRSYDQTKHPYVIFSPQFDNLLNSNYYTTDREYKSTTLVAGEGEDAERRVLEVGQKTSAGLKRYELYTDARDITSRPNQDEQQVDFIVNPPAIYQTPNGVTVSGPGDLTQEYARAEYKVQGMPTRTGSIFSITIFTIPTIPRGKYVLRGVPYKRDDGYVYTLSIPKLGLTLSSGTDEVKTVVNSTITSAPVIISMTIPTTAELKEIYSDSFRPELEMYEIHDTDYNNLLLTRGNEKLAENIVINEFDGDVDYTSQFLFKEHYNIGDVVQIENDFRMKGKSRIYEVSMSYDYDGFKLAPVFVGIDVR